MLRPALLLFGAAACAVLTAAALRPVIHALSTWPGTEPRGGVVRAGTRWPVRGPAACLLRPACAAGMQGRTGNLLHYNAPALRLALLGWAVWLIIAAAGRGAREAGRSAAGSARYARRCELQRLRTPDAGSWFPLGYLPAGPAARYLSRWGFGARSHRPWIGPQVRLPSEELARHVLVLGLTGARKTTAVVFPALLEAARQGVSAVAFDLKYGESDSLARVAPEWRRSGRDVQIFAPLDGVSLRWNPLEDCGTIGEAYHLASLLFDELDASNPDQLYWVGAERHVCALLAHALCTDGGEPALARLRVLCASGPDAVRRYIHAHAEGEMLGSALGAFHAMMPKDQAGILQGIASRLEAWGDDRVAAATGPARSWQRLDPRRVRQEPGLLIVGIPQAALSRLRWLCHFFLKSIAACLLSPRRPDEQVAVLLVLEELTTWGVLPGLADHLATYRSRGVSVLATLQSEAQGEHTYGSAGWAAIAANLVTKLYFPSLSDRDAERLSRALGTSGGEDLARSRAWGANGRRTSEQRRPVPVPLARPEDVRAWVRPHDEVLVRFDRLPPARLSCPPYSARPEYARSVPEGPVTTGDLALYHHMREIAKRRRPLAPAAASPPPAAPCAVSPAPCAPVSVHRSASQGVSSTGALTVPEEPRAPGSESTGARGADDDTPEDVRQLDQLVAVLLDGEAPPAGLTCIRGRDRVVEVRIAPERVAQCCGGPAGMHGVARRWSSLRWVRRIRPTFVLTRRALDRLDPGLRARLERLGGG